jgi:membrane-bound serine protease (ClpP class)
LLLTLAIGLLVAAMALCFLEILVVSFGAMTAAALACAGGSCWAAFALGPNTGWSFVVLNAVGMIASFVVSFRLFSNRLALRQSQVEDGGYQPVADLSGLAGKSGMAFTTLRPGGTALIDGRKVDVVAAGGMIEQHARIKVLTVEGTKVVVEREVL